MITDNSHKRRRAPLHATLALAALLAGSVVGPVAAQPASAQTPRAEAARTETARTGGIADLRIAKGQRNIAEAWLIDPTTRYQHFVLGSSYEAGGLAVRLKDGRVLKLTLPQTAVFEDRAPRLADLDGDGTDEIIVVKADLTHGAALAIVAVRADVLTIIAETPPTGRANTWRNPAAIADFDGDGRLDIAEVQMPHVLGKLRLWTLENGALKQIATLDDTSNHKGGAPFLKLAAAHDVNGDGVPELIIPSLDRRTLRLLSFKGRLVREIARQPLPKPAVRDLVVVKEGAVPVFRVGHEDGTRTDIRF